MSRRPAAGGRRRWRLACWAIVLAAACARPRSPVVALAPEVAQTEIEGGANLRGNRPLAHDRVEPRFLYRRGRNDERQRIADVQAAHARLAVLEAQIEQEKARRP